MICNLSELIVTARSHGFTVFVNLTEPAFFAELIGEMKHIGYSVDVLSVRGQWLRLSPEERRGHMMSFQEATCKLSS